ncbi:MAG TPA: glycoside hydrolase family 3 N-terminal domain-containing protein [Bacteroidia bacterium]|nr:glycoside hydrolase family 3 N-terminal domain-containing protein [Bacteroidia bacterium]
MKKIISLIVLFSFFSGKITAQIKPPFVDVETKWVDSVYASLSPDERLAQLFMIAAWSNKDMKHVRQIDSLVTKYNIGGLIFMQGGPVRQTKLANYYQSKAKTPLLMSIDGEFGLAMRLDSTTQYPRQMTLAAMANDSLIYYMGRQIARECKAVGIHVNFAPVADVNNNPNNPVISMRSFGEDKTAVAKKSYLYMKGLQDEHVLACAKHFPGHGDTDKDSHKTLPIVPYSLERLDTLELFPFKYLFDRGLGSIMVAHLFIPQLDTTKNLPSTLSKNIVQKLLKERMNFKGLVFTDALNMKGAADYNKPGMLDTKALLAGNDMLLFSEDVPKAMEEIKKAIANNEITQDEIDARCKKILKVKFWCGLDKNKTAPTRLLNDEINTNASVVLNTKLYENAITLLQNKNNLLPLLKPDTLKIAEVSVGVTDKNMFSQNMAQYFKTDFYGVSHNEKKSVYDTLLKKLAAYNMIIVQVNKTNQKPDDNFGANPQSIAFIDTLVKLKPTAVVFFSNPYIFNKYKNLSSAAAVIEGYEYNNYTQKAASDVIAGALGVSGKLPVTTLPFKRGTGLVIPTAIRMQQVAPIVLGIQKKKLAQIDSIAQKGISDKCYPGCQIVAAKDGKIFYCKSFGKYTYEGTDTVTNQSIYDIASVTKVASSALALMDLVGKKKIDVDQKLGHYLPELKKTNKENIIIKEMLTHQAGLPAWIPFYQSTLNKDNSFKDGYYSKVKTFVFSNQVADSLFIRTDFTDSIYKKIAASKLGKKGEYVYSDIGYYYTKKIIEQITKTPLNEYVQQNFYSKMGLCNMIYKPLNYFEKSEIVPTENDTKFRKQLIQGYVHDPGAALLGGVGGHAGLFANATDLAVLMQMYLNKGKYAGKQWLDSNTVKEFTQKCLYCPKNRRGLCFEKPENDPKKESPVARECSPQSFGHAGFTGTLVWADPANGLVYVFLSNRVYPNADENKLAKSGIRTKIQKLFYEAVSEAQPLDELLK